MIESFAAGALSIAGVNEVQFARAPFSSSILNSASCTRFSPTSSRRHESAPNASAGGFTHPIIRTSADARQLRRALSSSPTHIIKACL